LVRTVGTEGNGLNGGPVSIDDGAVSRCTRVLEKEHLGIDCLADIKASIARGFQDEDYLSLATGIGRYKPITASRA
jgi:hypothetical protein